MGSVVTCDCGLKGTPVGTCPRHRVWMRANSSTAAAWQMCPDCAVACMRSRVHTTKRRRAWITQDIDCSALVTTAHQDTEAENINAGANDANSMCLDSITILSANSKSAIPEQGHVSMYREQKRLGTRLFRDYSIPCKNFGLSTPRGRDSHEEHGTKWAAPKAEENRARGREW